MVIKKLGFKFEVTDKDIRITIDGHRVENETMISDIETKFTDKAFILDVQSKGKFINDTDHVQISLEGITPDDLKHTPWNEIIIKKETHKGRAFFKEIANINEEFETSENTV